jgi:hypothetical protein
MTRTPRAKPQVILSILSLLFFCGVTCFLYVHDLRGAPGAFWDAHVYSKALSAYRHGGDPYSAESPHLMFVYSPAVLKTMAAARVIFPARVLWYVYLALSCTASVCLPILISACLGTRWLSMSIAILIFSLLPGFAAEFSLLSGNIANLLYAIVLLALLHARRAGWWRWFYLAVIISGIVKPPMLAFLLIPLLLGYIGSSIVSGSIVALVFLAQRLFMPALYHRFAQAVYMQLVVAGDMGFGLFSRLPASLRTAAPVLFAAAVIAIFWYLRKDRLTPASVLWMPALLVTCILVSPRMLGYDAQIAILPGICLLLEAAPGWSDRAKQITGVLVSVVLLVLCKETSLYLISLFLLLALCAGVYQAISSRHAQHQPA